MIIATYQSHELEIVDTYRTGGVVMAVCHAIDGSEPFVGGDKWPVKTDWKNIPIAHLENIQEVEAPENDYQPEDELEY